MNDEYPHFAVVPGERLRLLRVLTVGYSSGTDAALHHTGLNLHRRIILDSIAPRAYATPGRWPWNTSAPAPPPPPPPPPLPKGYSMELVSSNGFPKGTFNHEAIDIESEEECKRSCLEKYRTCKALSWLQRPTEPCVHYQAVSAGLEPLSGCRYWRLVHNTSASSKTATAAEAFQALSPIYPLVAAISNKDNTPWLGEIQRRVSRETTLQVVESHAPVGLQLPTRATTSCCWTRSGRCQARRRSGSMSAGAPAAPLAVSLRERL